MVSAETRKQYTVTIGIECHVQLKTATKLFAAVSNDARDAEPNTLISHICLGMPGALPVLNEHAVELASRAAFALGSKPSPFSTFDRKHYFYPDLPLGYQITQFYQPIVLGGTVTIVIDGQEKQIGITRAHLEADAGKNTHPTGADYSLVDLNRAGTPLLEIVSEPDIHSAAEARAYAHELYLLMKYADVSDADLYHGNMRFDVNVSVSKTNELGTRTETKNLNSFRSVEKAAEYEINRQIELLEKGQKIDQETRGWDEAKQKTLSQRGKEQAHDYRYMPEPDIPPVELDEAFIERIFKSLPAMPSDWRQKLTSLGLDASQTAILIDAEVDSPVVNYLPLLEKVISDKSYAKQLANWFVNIEIPFRSDEANIVELPNEARAPMYHAVYELVTGNKLSSSNAKLLITELLGHNSLPESVEKYADEQGLVQVSDTGEIEKIVVDVITANPAAAEDVRNGEMKAIGFLVGQVMKASQGKANPGLAQELLRKHLM
ncbi:Asp-tRNA(Asn)/Glu-tRNA(Gln) amidotransferase subunit GatB [Candidatus Saccharibacteria bacterium]|nr:MAG: Asp-tRNA(Asn)/Glu-tRNA(Gln) amidotransferase subunit GatB [Candidatus Saccharibacteria bacterium]